MSLDWDKIVSNAVTVLVATVFVGAAAQLWTGVQTIDSRIDANLVDIKSTQEVLAPKVDEIEKRLLEILSKIDDSPEDTSFKIPSKRALELIDEHRISNQVIQRQQR